MDKDYLLLKRAALSRPSGEWDDADYDVLADGEVVGRIFKLNSAPPRNYRSGSNARQDSKRHAASGAVSGRFLMDCLAACRTSNQFEAQMRRMPSGSNPITLPK